METEHTPKIVVLPDGKRRTIQPWRIIDLQEIANGTRVFYESSVPFDIDLPFDDLYSSWQQYLQDRAWQPR